jgi:tripartite-type tricarboxylate transporter receptor subunit TctC
MKKLFLAVLTAVSINAYAAEKISMFMPYAPSASSIPAMLRLADEANKLQSDYEFLVDFKPGGNQVLSLKAMDQSPKDSVSLIAPAYIENHRSKIIDKNNYVPVWALGDACWAVFTNVGDTTKGIKSLAGTKELIVGGVGYGNASHLTSIMLAEKFNFKTRYIVFKSNTDALINMVGNHGINMAIDKIEGYASFKPKNDKLQMLAVSCPTRMPAAPDVKTLREQGINAPMVFNIIVANKAMDDYKRTKIRAVLTLAAERMGPESFMKLSGMSPPQFNGVSADEFYIKSLTVFDSLLTKYEKAIDSAKNAN